MEGLLQESSSHGVKTGFIHGKYSKTRKKSTKQKVRAYRAKLLLLTIEVLPKADSGSLATTVCPHPLGGQEQRFQTLAPTSRAPHLQLRGSLGQAPVPGLPFLKGGPQGQCGQASLWPPSGLAPHQVLCPLDLPRVAAVGGSPLGPHGPAGMSLAVDFLFHPGPHLSARGVFSKQFLGWFCLPGLKACHFRGRRRHAPKASSFPTLPSSYSPWVCTPTKLLYPRRQPWVLAQRLTRDDR